MTGQGGYRLPEPCGFHISVLQADKVFERSVHRLKVKSSTLDGARSHCAAMALPGYMGSGKHPDRVRTAALAQKTGQLLCFWRNIPGASPIKSCDHFFVERVQLRQQPARFVERKSVLSVRVDRRSYRGDRDMHRDLSVNDLSCEAKHD